LAKEKRSGESKKPANSFLWVIVKRVQKIYAYFEVVLKKRNSSDYLLKLQELDVPVLLLYADEDSVSPSISFKVLADNLPVEKTKVIVFSGDHGITHEQPELFKKYLNDFINEI
jgi:pimeloyl-ACP methyl ester carboxylesterase